MKFGIVFLTVLFGVCIPATHAYYQENEDKKFKVFYEWKQLEFEYATDNERQRDIDSGNFNVGKILPFDVDVYYPTNQTFITITRTDSGVPATLGTVTDKTLNGNPIIRPYPDWSWHRNLNSCHTDRIVSSYRVMIDECGRLWTLDNGKIGDDEVCPPQILAFDLRTNKLIHRHVIQLSILESNVLFVTTIVDTQGPNCENTFIYMLDVQMFNMYVHDFENNATWRIQDKTFYPYPDYATFKVAGEQFIFMDGLLGAALSPIRPGEDRKLYYHAMSSPTENWVYTSVLKNRSLFENSPFPPPHLFHTFKGKRNTQSCGEAMDKNGILYFGLLEELAVACWNSATEYGPENIEIIEYDPVTLQFSTGLKVTTNPDGQEELWVLTNRFQKYANGTLDGNDTQFRILYGTTDDLLKGTKCKYPTRHKTIHKSGHLKSNAVKGRHH